MRGGGLRLCGAFEKLGNGAVWTPFLSLIMYIM